MDPFNRLPPELIQAILTHAADAIATESLLYVSPRVHAVFQADPKAYLNRITANPITQRPEIYRLIQNVVVLCSKTHCPSLEQYQQTCASLSGLPEQMDSVDIFRLIRIASRIQRLTCICLSTMRQHFISAIETHPAGEQPGPVRAVKGADPFTWIEHYRVSWALWHLQHFSDLKQTAQSRWTWSPTSLAELDRYLVWNEVWNGRSNARAEQIWTITPILGDLGLHPEYQTPNLFDLGLQGARAWLIRPVQEDPTLEPPLALWGYPPETTPPFFPSFQLPTPTPTPTCWSPPPTPDTAPVHWHWGQTVEKSDRVSAPTAMLRAYSIQMRRDDYLHEGLWDMRPFRRLGAVIWDDWRLYQVGLFGCYARQQVPTPDGGYIEGLGGGPVSGRIHPKEMQARWVAFREAFRRL